MIMVKCMLKAPLHLKGPIRKLFYRLVRRVFFGIDIVCALFLLVIFSSCCFMLFTLCMVQLCLVVKKKCVDMADLFYSSFLFKLSQNQHFGTVYCSLFFFFSVILFSIQILSVKRGYCMCESCCLSIYFATCVIMF